MSNLAILVLFLAKLQDKGDGGSTAWEIDLIACPSEGRTPLHDALANGHTEVACMLLNKGGVKLLDIVDVQVCLLLFRFRVYCFLP